MEENNWVEVYNELYDLHEEFIQKWRKNINDLKYHTKVRENEKRISEIISNFIKIVKRHDKLYQVIFDEKDENYKTYMELTGLRKESEFYNYSGKIIRKLEEEYLK